MINTWPLNTGGGASQNLLRVDVSGNIALNWTIFNGFGIQANKNKLEQLQIQS